MSGVAKRWASIEAWLTAEYPKGLGHFNPPASAQTISAAECALGVTLPADYKAFLRIHNGQRELAPMVGPGSLFAVEEIAAARALIFDEPTPINTKKFAVAAGVQPLTYCEQWIPISRSSSMRGYLCIDLAPAAGGVVGQIIKYASDHQARPLVAASFADLLSMYLTQVQTGEIDLRKMEEWEDD